MRKNALPPVAARSSTASAASRPVQRRAAPRPRRGEAADGTRVKQPVAGQRGGDRSSSGVGSSAGDRAVASDHRPRGQLVAQHVLDHLQRRRRRPTARRRARSAAGARGTRRGGARRRSRTAGTARRWGPAARRARRGRGGRARAAAGQDAPIGGHATTGLRRDRAQRGAQRLDHRLERHDRLRRRPSPQHDAAQPVRVGGEPGGQARLAGAGLADEQREVAVAGDRPPTSSSWSGRELRAGARRTPWRWPARPGRAAPPVTPPVAAPAMVPDCRRHGHLDRRRRPNGPAATAGPCEQRVVVEDRRLQLDQRRRRIEAQLVGQDRPRAAEGTRSASACRSDRYRAIISRRVNPSRSGCSSSRPFQLG